MFAEEADDMRGNSAQIQRPNRHTQLLMRSELTTLGHIKVRISWHVTQSNFLTF